MGVKANRRSTWCNWHTAAAVQREGLAKGVMVIVAGITTTSTSEAASKAAAAAARTGSKT